MDSIRALVRSVALEGDGEAWRAVTERGEVLCDYSVYDVARELSGRHAACRAGADNDVIVGLRSHGEQFGP